MKSVSVRAQLALAFGVLIVLVVVMGIVAVRSLSVSNERFSNYVTGAAERKDLATDVSVLANRRAIYVRDLVLVKTDQERSAAKVGAVESHESLHKAMERLNTAVDRASGASDQERLLVSAIKNVEAKYAPVALSIVDLASSGKRDEAIERMNTECRPLLAALINASREYVDHSKILEEQASKASEQAYSSQRTLMVSLAVSAALIAVALGWSITKRLMAALGAEPAQLSLVVKNVASGDLSPVSGAEAARAGSVLSSMGAMQHQLVDLIGQVRKSADSIQIASAEIAQGNADLSSRTEQQAAALEETAASMEQLNATVKQNAENARQANQLAQSASAVAIKGGDVVGQVVATMKDINDSSKKISDIISVIDGIAFQTNILALNAAVEAARAGEQGRGFAVVASEVRNLAGRSADAAKEIKGLIGASVERVEQGSLLVDRAGVTMTEVVTSINRVTDLMGEISAASVEQSAGVSQVGEAVTQMDQATQQNAALVEQSAAAAESMNTQAKQLVEAISIFKVAQHSRSGASLVPTRSTTMQERRGPHRAKNVVRPKFSEPKSLENSTPEMQPSRTGTDGWASF